MSSEKRVLSSRANGARSRGPVTPAGKQASSLNAIRHGLLAKCVVLTNECRENFDILMAQHLDRYRPADDVELSVVEEMASAFWRLRRTWAIETRLYDDAINAREPGDEVGRIAGAFTDLAASSALALLHRYEARLHHIRQRAFKNIHILRNTPPPPNEPILDPPSPNPAADPTPAAPATTPAKLAPPPLPNEPTFAPAAPATTPAPPAKLAPLELPNEPTFTPEEPPEEPLFPSNRLYVVISQGPLTISDDPQPAEPQAALFHPSDAIPPAPAQCRLPSPGTPERHQSGERDFGASAAPTARTAVGGPSAERWRPVVATSRLGHRRGPASDPLRHGPQAALAILRLLHPDRPARAGPFRIGCRRRPPPPKPQPREIRPGPP